jgi:5'(3')-deoxyribonucleotidase
MIIAVDVDDTVAHLIERWLQLYNVDYNDNMTSVDVIRWEISQCVKPECGQKIWSYLERPDLYDKVRPVPGALEGIAALRAAGHRIVFVTSCGSHAGTIGRAGDKFSWLVRNGFLLNVKHPHLDFIVCADKTQVAADVLIDDRADTVSAWIAQRRPAILVDRPHNATHKGFNLVRAHGWQEIVHMVARVANAKQAPAEQEMMLPADSASRKELPICTGVLDYFPLAFAALARLSKKGNDKHNPGQPLHWSRAKSADHRDCIVKHLIDSGIIDPDNGELHDVSLAWRAMANLELAEEKRLGKPVARGSRI